MLSSRLRSIICAPLHNSKGVPVGILQIDTTDDPGQFESEDLKLLIAVAGPLGLAIEIGGLMQDEIRRQSLEVRRVAFEHQAREVQRTLIPDIRPGPTGYDFWDHYGPAQFVGGDYFDYVPLEKHAAGLGSKPETTLWAVAVGDVSGKGVAAALYMARLQTQVRLLFRETKDPVDVVEKLDYLLCEAGQPDRFITFLLAILDSQRHEIVIVNAGHNAPLLRHYDGRVELLTRPEGGIPLGIEVDRRRGFFSIRLDPGQTVVLYTDGFLDALDPTGNAFGLVRLQDAVSSARGSAEEIGAHVLQAVKVHTAGFEQFDDMTLLCFTRESGVRI